MHAFEQPLLLCVIYFLCITSAGVKCSNEAIISTTSVDVHGNLTLQCPIKNDYVMWIHEGRGDDERKLLHEFIQEDGSLFLQDVEKDHSGIYVCMSSNSLGDENVHKVRVSVRTAPPRLMNVRVQASTILAVIVWRVNDSGGYPISYFTAQFRLADSDEEWQEITPIHIMPSSRQIDVYKLVPNTTYSFRIWAVNQLGESDIVVLNSTTKISNEAAELERHFLEGAKNFDPRIWLIAVVIVMGTLAFLGAGTCLLLYQECKTPSGDVDDQEVIELVPNIILNPGYEENGNTTMSSHQLPDENSNNEITTRLNNNTVIQQRRVS